MTKHFNFTLEQTNVLLFHLFFLKKNNAESLPWFPTVFKVLCVFKQYVVYCISDTTGHKCISVVFKSFKIVLFKVICALLPH